MKISLVIPVFNESEVITVLYSRIDKALKKDFPKFQREIIFIDDGSTDNTFNELKKLHKKDPSVKVIQLSRNFGHQIAISAGLDKTTGDIIVMMDGDLQDQPEEIIKLYKKLQEGYDVVYAIRKNKKFGFFKRFSSYLFNVLMRRLIKEKIVINSTIFRIATKQVIQEVRSLRESNRYLVGIIGWVGFNHAPQPVEHGKRYKGKTKYTLSQQLNLALDAIFAYSAYPLHFFLKVGGAILLLDFLFIVFIIFRKIAYNGLINPLEIFAAILVILGGMQIIILAIIGEYVGRLYIENKNRPLYIIKSEL
ncbi:MAG: glycosyl transferase [Patescibacteria group bacterium]|nr:MAG: glycosyl transferase [Patescibacteria group bacterium]